MTNCKTCEQGQSEYRSRPKNVKAFPGGFSRNAQMASGIYTGGKRRVPLIKREVPIEEPDTLQIIPPVIETEPEQYYYEDITTESSNPVDLYNTLTTDNDRLAYLQTFVNPDSGLQEGWKKSAEYLGIVPTEGMMKIINKWVATGKPGSTAAQNTIEFPATVRTDTTRVWYGPNKQPVDTLTADQKKSAIVLEHKNGGIINYFKFFK